MSRIYHTFSILERMTGVQLDFWENQFVGEYTKDYDHRRAAEAIGLKPDDGIDLLQRSNVAEAVRHVYNHQIQSSQLTAETVKEDMHMLFKIALQKGNLSVASKQLDQLAKHAHIDAYAAQKVAVAADAEIAQRLAEGRKRVARAKQKVDFMGNSDD